MSAQSASDPVEPGIVTAIGPNMVSYQLRVTEDHAYCSDPEWLWKIEPTTSFDDLCRAFHRFLGL